MKFAYSVCLILALSVCVLGVDRNPLFPVEVNDKTGFIDRTGRVVIEPKFEWAGKFSDGLAPVVIDGKWGFIDKTGSLVIKPTFVHAYDFSEGFARVATHVRLRRPSHGDV